MALGPTQSFTKDNVKVRWGERYTSDALNKKFLGIPRGIYLGFVPSPVGLLLNLKTDKVVTFYNGSTTPFAINDVITGGTSLTNAIVRSISNGFLLVDSVSGGSGTFDPGESIQNGSLTASATVGQFVQEGVSFARVVSGTPLVAGRSEDMVDIITGDDVQLDFTGFNDGTYHIYATGAYSVGAVTTSAIASRTAPPPNGLTEVLICQVIKLGLTLTVLSTSPATRQEPFASQGTRIGFMPGGSIEALNLAVNSVLEVISARRGSDGVTAAPFNPAAAQTTGLPSRLNRDLSPASMASRLGKNRLTIQGNDFSLLAGATSINVSGSFAARNRALEPYKDISPATGIAVPAGVPVAIPASGSPYVDLAVTGGSGTWTPGLLVTGATSGATAIIKVVTGVNPTPTLSVGDFVGTLFVGEVIAQTLPAATGTIATIDQRQGALTEVSGAPATSPNVVTIIDAATGSKPFEASTAAPIYGRLVYGPGGASNPGELTLTGGQQLNFASGSSTVVVAAGPITTPAEIAVGDIIEGADGRFYEVETITGSPNIASFTTPVAKPYVGPTVSNSGGRRRRKFNLEFKKIVAGVETAATLPIGTYRLFFPAWFTAEKSNFDATMSSQAPESVALAVAEAVDGTGAITTVGGTVALTAAQASDHRLGRVITGTGNGTGGVTNSGRKTIKINQGSGIGVVVTDSPGSDEVVITITNSNPGGGGPAAYGGPMFPDVTTAGGVAGSGGYAQGSHQHPISPIYAIQKKFQHQTGNGTMVIPFTFTPRLAIQMSFNGGNVGAGIADKDANQASIHIGGGGGAVGSASIFIVSITLGTWTIAYSPGVSATLTPAGVSGSWDISVLILGDNLP